MKNLQQRYTEETNHIISACMNIGSQEYRSWREYIGCDILNIGCDIVPSSAHLFMIEIGSHIHKERKQPQRISIQYSCSVIMINVTKNICEGKFMN